MCIICVELIKGKMGSIDAINNMLERIDDFDEKHVATGAVAMSADEQSVKVTDDNGVVRVTLGKLS